MRRSAEGASNPGRTHSNGVRRLLLAHPHAFALPPAHDPGHCLGLLVEGQAEAHPLHRLANVLRREPFENLRGVEPARRSPG